VVNAFIENVRTLPIDSLLRDSGREGPAFSCESIGPGIVSLGFKSPCENQQFGMADPCNSPENRDGFGIL
jgi:hypothetical protein